MDTVLPGDLAALWRERAETLSTYGDPNSARHEPGEEVINDYGMRLDPVISKQ
jgi:hypothetical protein